MAETLNSERLRPFVWKSMTSVRPNPRCEIFCHRGCKCFRHLLHSIRYIAAEDIKLFISFILFASVLVRLVLSLVELVPTPFLSSAQNTPSSVWTETLPGLLHDISFLDSIDLPCFQLCGTAVFRGSASGPLSEPHRFPAPSSKLCQIWLYH